MSRNKDIKLLHDLTTLPYKECRRHMKANDWDFVAAYLQVYGITNGNVTRMMNLINDMVKQLTVAFADLTRVLGESLIEISNNMKGVANESDNHYGDNLLNASSDLLHKQEGREEVMFGCTPYAEEELTTVANNPQEYSDWLAENKEDEAVERAKGGEA